MSMYNLELHLPKYIEEMNGRISLIGKNTISDDLYHINP